MDIRHQTGIIIEKDGRYLVGNVVGLNILRWSESPWDAWRTRKRESADLVARAVGGRQMLFNPVAGQLKTLHPIALQNVI